MAGEGLAEAAVEFAGAAEEGELELVVGAPAEIVGAQDDVLDGAVDVEHGDAFADPFFVHQLGGMGPDFEVVGEHEVFGDAFAEDFVDELPKVSGGLVVALGLGFDEAGEAFVGDFLGEVADVVLEGVGHPAIEHADPAFAVVELEVAAHELVEASVVVLVVGEHDVAADVPGEAGGVGEAGGKAAEVAGGARTCGSFCSRAA